VLSLVNFIGTFYFQCRELNASNGTEIGCQLFRFLLYATDYQCEKGTIKPEQLPENISVSGMAGGIAAAYNLYNITG
jgi:hypothetical protein